jgi:MFS family permease
MSPAQPCPPAAAAPGDVALYRAGSLVYTRGRLRTVFAWLLAGEVVFTLIDMLEPKLLPVLLKLHGATDHQIAIIVGSFTAVLQLLIMPPAGYFSDRLRTRHGRRIPLLLWATPLATLFLAITPFAPEIAAWATGLGTFGAWLQSLSIAPVVLCFGLMVLLYRAVQTVTNVAFFGLLRDVVPDTHMGRFLALFRVFGAIGTFIITYWLLGHAATHSKPIFLGVAALNLIGFGAICLSVKEGTYPPVGGTSATPAPARRLTRLLGATRTFVRESYRHPIYLWTYVVRVCIYGALLGLSGFIVFFPHHELGMSLAETGAMLSWPSLVWLVLAYPVGKLVDARGALFTLRLGLAMITVGYGLSFFLVAGPMTFLVSSLVTGIAFWIVMLAQLKLTQEIFHPQRYSQLAGANTVVQSIAIALLISPVAGWMLDALKDWRPVVEMPLLGPVTWGPYRLVNLMLAALYGVAWIGLARVRHHWLKLGGPKHYVAPL